MRRPPSYSPVMIFMISLSHCFQIILQGTKNPGGFCPKAGAAWGDIPGHTALQFCRRPALDGRLSGIPELHGWSVAFLCFLSEKLSDTKKILMGKFWTMFGLPSFKNDLPEVRVFISEKNSLRSNGFPLFWEYGGLSVSSRVNYYSSEIIADHIFKMWLFLCYCLS